MRGPTDPTIFEAENTADSQRLVAAQARIYSDAKRIFFGRVLAVAILSIVTIAIAAAWPSLRATVGGGVGLLLFAASLFVEGIEKRLRLQAASIQEVFDTRIYQIEWNSLHASRPPSLVISRAAARYRGGRESNWYDDTEGTHRPFDILICQASNLGWGATMHRIWGHTLVGLATASLIAIATLWYVLALPFGEGVLALLVPALAPLKEIATLIRSNFENSTTKETAERQINEIWIAGMSQSVQPTDVQVRALQDKLLLLRQTNAYVPDWLDSIFHEKNEAAMRASVADRILEARRHQLG